MDRHFISWFEEERDVLRKIEELKARGYTESEMYVVARTNEQLTMVRTRTGVEYHAAEGKGMGRFGMWLRGGANPVPFNEITDEAKETAFLYQQLLEGKLLLYSNKNTEDIVSGRPAIFTSEEADPEADPSLQLATQSDDEDRIYIDSIHYEFFQPVTTEGNWKKQKD